MTVIFYLLITIILVIIDQYAKALIVANIPLGKQIELLPGFFSLTYVRNYGAGFSIMQNATFFLLAVSVLAIIVLSCMLIKTGKKDTLNKLSYLLIISGAAGNLIDRIRLGYVVDFLDFVIFGWDYPVFNIADSFITVGCFLILFQSLWEKKNA